MNSDRSLTAKKRLELVNLADALNTGTSHISVTTMVKYQALLCSLLFLSCDRRLFSL
jgi:hypothetical protein